MYLKFYQELQSLGIQAFPDMMGKEKSRIHDMGEDGAEGPLAIDPSDLGDMNFDDDAQLNDGEFPIVPL